MRGGLTPDVLESLRRADRVSLAIKDNRTAVLGFWIADELRVALIDAEPLLLQVRPGPSRSSPPIRPLHAPLPRPMQVSTGVGEAEQ